MPKKKRKKKEEPYCIIFIKFLSYVLKCQTLGLRQKICIAFKYSLNLSSTIIGALLFIFFDMSTQRGGGGFELVTSASSGVVLS
jgi:hypothetical protein